jgi:hypothetical protein
MTTIDLMDSANVYTLHDWMPKEVEWNQLCGNEHPKAIRMLELHLEKHPEDMNYLLFRNKEAIHLIQRHDRDTLSMINRSQIYMNENAWSLIQADPDKWMYIPWLCMNQNKESIAYIENHCLDQLNDAHWHILCENPSAIHLIEKHPEKISWVHLSKNPAAAHILFENMSKIYMYSLCQNPSKEAIEFLSRPEIMRRHDFNVTSLCLNKNAIPLIEQHIDHPDICWQALSVNPNAIDLLLKNKEKIDWIMIWSNPGIFTYDYSFMKMRANLYKEELMSVLFHPRNYHKFATWGFDEFTDDFTKEFTAEFEQEFTEES